MNINTFAEEHKLAYRRDPQDGTVIIPARLGQMYEYNNTRLAVMFMPTGNPRPRLWSSVRGRCLAVGMTLLQNGDAEGSLSFDPSNEEQSAVAITVVRAKRKRVASPTQLANLAKGTPFQSRDGAPITKHLSI